MKNWMRRMAAVLIALAALCAAAAAETLYDTVRLTFEDGFSLSVPADWVSYEVPDELADEGYCYCLGSADGERLMYIQLWPTSCEDLDALREMLSVRDEIVLREGSEDQTNFLMYNFVEEDCSGCATLLGDRVLNLLFIPQSDADNMLIAATVMESYEAVGE